MFRIFGNNYWPNFWLVLPLLACDETTNTLYVRQSQTAHKSRRGRWIFEGAARRRRKLGSCDRPGAANKTARRHTQIVFPPTTRSSGMAGESAARPREDRCFKTLGSSRVKISPSARLRRVSLRAVVWAYALLVVKRMNSPDICPSPSAFFTPPFSHGTTLAERLACSPPTMAIRVQSPAESHRIFACGNHAGRCRWLAGFLVDLPFPPPFHSDAAPYSPQSPSSLWLANSPPPPRQGDPSSIPGGFAPAFSHVGIVPGPCRLPGGFSRGTPRSPALAFQHRSVSFRAVFRDDGHLRVPAGKSVTRMVTAIGYRVRAALGSHDPPNSVLSKILKTVRRSSNSLRPYLDCPRERSLVLSLSRRRHYDVRENALWSSQFVGERERAKEREHEHGCQRGCESERRVYIVVHSPSRALSSELGQQRGLSVTSRVSERVPSRRIGTRPKSRPNVFTHSCFSPSILLLRVLCTCAFKREVTFAPLSSSSQWLRDHEGPTAVERLLAASPPRLTPDQTVPTRSADGNPPYLASRSLSPVEADVLHEDRGHADLSKEGGGEGGVVPDMAARVQPRSSRLKASGGGGKGHWTQPSKCSVSSDSRGVGVGMCILQMPMSSELWADLPWRSRLARCRSVVREALDSNPGQDLGLRDMIISVTVSECRCDWTQAGGTSECVECRGARGPLMRVARHKSFCHLPRHFFGKCQGNAWNARDAAHSPISTTARTPVLLLSVLEITIVLLAHTTPDTALYFTAFIIVRSSTNGKPS
ncbi:hypothetical protein PR048_032492 [Dryococelus australis]|uniref:Uncharacterized protein n=1 Tax=Dryococelus australis TaxID=614101 RepID=A0ABQ9G2C6_9NEOP|nr:hypothetical protein PR048_032492 [Dryococelus australis]